MAITKIQSNAFPATIDLSNIDLTIGANEIVTANIADSNITTAKIADTAIHTGKVADLAITHAKLHTDMDLTGKTVTLPDLNQTLTIDRSSSNGTPIVDLYTNKSQGEFSKLRFYNQAYSSIPMATISAQVPTANVYGRLDFKVNNANNDETVMSLYEGNVGIGTSSPQRKLSIANGGPVVEIDPAGGAAGPIYFNYNRSTATYLTPEYWALAHIWNVNGGAEAMRLTSTSLYTASGINVGIGTSSVATKLHVYQNTNNGTINNIALLDAGNQNPSVAGSGVAMDFRSNGGSSYFGAVGGYSDGTNYVAGLWGGAAASGAPDLVVNSSGNVGIGTTSPSGKLQVKQANTAYGLVVEASGNDAWVRFHHNDSVGIVESTYNTSAGYTPLTFKTGGSERAHIDTSGNVGIGTTFTSLFNSVGGSTRLAVCGSSASTDILGNTGASISIINTDTTANNTAGLHFARADTDDSPNYAGASIVTQFHDTQVTAQYPKASMNFLTSTAANTAPSLKMRITSAGGIEHTAPDGQNGEAYRTRYASGSSNVVKVNEAIYPSANGDAELWFRMIVPQNYYHDAINAGVLTVSAINLAIHATGSGIFQKVICIGTNHNSSYNAAVSTLINSKSEDSYYGWTNTLEFYRNNDQSSDALREVTYIKSRRGYVTNFLLNVEGWIRYGNRLTLTFLGTTAPSNITLIG